MPGMSDGPNTVHFMNPTASLKELSNDALLSATRDIVGKSSAIEADLIEHLAEIDERKLYLEYAHPSMFAFCVDELGFSEDAAGNRITVARAARRIPAILDALRSGQIHLTGLRILAPHITEANHELLLPQAYGKSKQLIEELVARIAPRPPVRTWIRRIPENPAMAWSPIPRQSLLIPSTLEAQTAAATVMAAPDAFRAPAGETAVTAAKSPSTSNAESPASFPPGFVPPRSGPRAVMSPLSGTEFSVQFTASRTLRDKLLEAKGLLRHRIPNGDLPTIIEQALDLLIEKVKKERFGIGRKPRESSARAVVEDRVVEIPTAELMTAASEDPKREHAADAAFSASETTAQPATAATEVAASTTEPAPKATTDPPAVSDSGVEEVVVQGAALSRHIPDAIKRAVYERDGGRCAYEDERGRRCGSTDRITFDHRRGFVLTRVHSVEDIRVVCWAHNQYEAERMFGREFMERARAGSPPVPAEPPLPIRPGAD